MPRSVRAACLVFAAVVAVGGCTLDRAELHEAGGTITSEFDDLRVLTYRDDPATDDWVDLVTPDPAVLDEGDEFREDDSRTASPDEPADVRRLFTRVGSGAALLVQLDRVSNDLQVWEFTEDGDDPAGAFRASGIARDDEPNEVEDGDLLTVVRSADAGDAVVEISGDDDVVVERVATHVRDDGVDVRIDVYNVTGLGRATITYADDRGTTTYDVVSV